MYVMDESYLRGTIVKLGGILMSFDTGIASSFRMAAILDPPWWISIMLGTKYQGQGTKSGGGNHFSQRKAENHGREI